MAVLQGKVVGRAGRGEFVPREYLAIQLITHPAIVIVVVRRDGLLCFTEEVRRGSEPTL